MSTITDRHESQLPPILFETDLANLLGIAVSTMREARRRRAWPFTELPRIGRKPRWSRDAVLATINTGVHAPGGRRAVGR